MRRKLVPRWPATQRKGGANFHICVLLTELSCLSFVSQTSTLRVMLKEFWLAVCWRLHIKKDGRAYLFITQTPGYAFVSAIVAVKVRDYLTIMTIECFGNVADKSKLAEKLFCSQSTPNQLSSRRLHVAHPFWLLVLTEICRVEAQRQKLNLLSTVSGANWTRQKACQRPERISVSISLLWMRAVLSIFSASNNYWWYSGQVQPCMHSSNHHLPAQHT